MLLVSRLALTKMLLHAKDAKVLGENSLRLTSHCSANIIAFRGACGYRQRPQRILCHAQKLLAIFPSDQSIYPLPPKLKAPSDKLPRHIHMTSMIIHSHMILESFSFHSTTNCMFVSYLIPSMELTKLVK